MMPTPAIHQGKNNTMIVIRMRQVMETRSFCLSVNMGGEVVNRVL